MASDSIVVMIMVVFVLIGITIGATFNHFQRKMCLDAGMQVINGDCVK